jgi:hypothetical protein
MQSVIVALVGMPAAGKSTVAQLLRDTFGYKWIRTREIVAQFAASSAMTDLQSAGVQLSAGDGVESFAAELFRRIDDRQPNVIDAIRPKAHWQRLLAEYKERVRLVAVICPLALREKRTITAGRSELLGLRDSHEVEADVPSLVEASTYALVNTDFLEFRVRQLASFIEQSCVLA